MNLFKKTVLVSSLGLGLILTGCEDSPEKAAQKQEEKAQEVRNIVDDSFKDKSVVEAVKIPDRSAFRTIDENFFNLYEIKYMLSKVKDDNNISRDNDYPLDYLANNQLFDDGEVALERNSVLKMEKAQVSLLPKAKEATKNIKDVEYIKVPFAFNDTDTPFVSIQSIRNNTDGKNGKIIDFKLDPNNYQYKLAQNPASFVLGPLSPEDELAIARLNRNSKTYRGDAYYVIQHNERNGVSATPAYIDYQIVDNNGSVIYKGTADSFK